MSFQVKIQLAPKVCAVKGKIRLPATVDEDEEDSSEYEEVTEEETESE